MTNRHVAVFAGILMMSAMGAPAAMAQGLLGTSTDNLVDIGSGPAGTDALVNVGVGGGNNIADVRLGRAGGLEGSANLSSNSGGGLGGTVNLGFGDLDGDIALGLGLGSNPGLGLDIDIGLGGGSNGGGGGGGGGNGGNGGNGNGGSGGGGVLVGSNGGALGFDAACSLDDGRMVLQMAARGQVSGTVIAGWQQAANVRVLPVKLCPAARSQVAQILRASGKINTLRGAAAADMLISASLSRSSYDPNDIFAIERNGGALTVYVF